MKTPCFFDVRGGSHATASRDLGGTVSAASPQPQKNRGRWRPAVSRPRHLSPMSAVESSVTADPLSALSLARTLRDFPPARQWGKGGRGACKRLTQFARRSKDVRYCAERTSSAGMLLGAPQTRARIPNEKPRPEPGFRNRHQRACVTTPLPPSSSSGPSRCRAGRCGRLS